MKLNLDRLFAAEEPAKQSCTVVGRMFPGRYKVKDKVGRVLQVDSPDVLRPGESVVVQSGRIVGMAANVAAEIVEV